MRTGDVLLKIAVITASQWGMVTVGQASAAGVSRLALSRLAAAGHLERVAQGVYRAVGVPVGEFDDLRAAWISTEPQTLAEDRLALLADGVVVASSSAARLHGIGDFWADNHEFVAPKRRQSQRGGIRYRVRQLEVRDVTLREGLPVMTLERTIADLLDDVGELSRVADTLGAAAAQRGLDLDRLSELFTPLAERNGFGRRDGRAVLDGLLAKVGLDGTATTHGQRELGATR